MHNQLTFHVYINKVLTYLLTTYMDILYSLGIRMILELKVLLFVLGQISNKPSTKGPLNCEQGGGKYKRRPVDHKHWHVHTEI